MTKILVNALIKHLPRSLVPVPHAETLCSGAAMSAMAWHCGINHSFY
ncbi:hypothetical protein [Proteus columbae]|nr:hypothetical protein [Proteus columbae]